jgi:acyl carrier protein
MDELVEQLKTDIIYALDLAEVAPADFNGDTPLFDEGVGLNSIDALEIVVLLERKYALKIEDLKNRRTVLYSIRSIAEYITQCRNQQQPPGKSSGQSAASDQLPSAEPNTEVAR